MMRSKTDGAFNITLFEMVGCYHTTLVCYFVNGPLALSLFSNQSSICFLCAWPCGLAKELRQWMRNHPDVPVDVVERPVATPSRNEVPSDDHDSDVEVVASSYHSYPPARPESGPWVHDCAPRSPWYQSPASTVLDSDMSSKPGDMGPLGDTHVDQPSGGDDEPVATPNGDGPGMDQGDEMPVETPNSDGPGMDQPNHDGQGHHSDEETPQVPSSVPYKNGAPDFDEDSVPTLGDAAAERFRVDEHHLSPNAIRQRAKRIFTKRVDGSMKVSQQIFDEWKGGGTKKKTLEQIFKSVGYCPEPCLLKALVFFFFVKLNDVYPMTLNTFYWVSPNTGVESIHNLYKTMPLPPADNFLHLPFGLS